MNTQEKLQKCIEFIRRIERGDFSYDDPGELRDRAWHLLADVDGL